MRRPKDYQPVDNAVLPLPGIIASIVADTPHKIFIGSIPAYLNEEQIIELLRSFGELRSFNLVKDTGTGLSKGFAFCEYLDVSVTDAACEGLNGMELGDKKLIVQRAAVGQKDGTKPGQVTASIVSILPPHLLNSANVFANPSPNLLLLNLLYADELEDHELIERVKNDIRSECVQFGAVENIKVEPTTACGRIYVKFASEKESERALRELSGRVYDGRTVVACFGGMVVY